MMLQQNLTCLRCNKQLTGRQRRYCSNRCRMAYKRAIRKRLAENSVKHALLALHFGARYTLVISSQNPVILGKLERIHIADLVEAYLSDKMQQPVKAKLFNRS